jgi:hypothetical protein
MAKKVATPDWVRVPAIDLVLLPGPSYCGGVHSSHSPGEPPLKPLAEIFDEALEDDEAETFGAMSDEELDAVASKLGYDHARVDRAVQAALAAQAQAMPVSLADAFDEALMDDEAETFAAMTDEQLEAEARKLGYDEARVQGAIDGALRAAGAEPIGKLEAPTAATPAKVVDLAMIFPRFGGRSDYAANAAICDLNSNSIGLT